MTPKEFLNQYLEATSKINGKLDEIRKLRSLAVKVTQTLTPNRISSGENRGRVETAVAKIVDMEKEVSADIGQLRDVKRIVEGAIERVSDERYRKVLRLKYINGKTWAQICTALYSERSDFPDKYDSYLRNIYRWHGIGLQQIEQCH